MKFESVWRYESGGYGHEDASRNALPQRILGGAALAGIALACAWTLYANLIGNGAAQTDLPSLGDRLDLADSRGDRLVAAQSALPPVSHTYVPLFDPHYSLGSPPGTFSGTTFAGRTFAEWFAANAPVQSPEAQSAIRAPVSTAFPQAQDVPPATSADHAATPGAAASASQLRSPPIRTALLRARPPATHVAADASTVAPTIFEKLFGKPFGSALAYASPDDGDPRSGVNSSGGYDGQTAVYDISTHTVYMPDGTQLEAHSGYGDMLDDPRYVREKDRGVTPPNVYDLELRDGLFHGVQALRLIPVDDSKVFGRSGFLAHSFMLGPNGDSNGCVSFRNYDAFLQAYMNHEVKRLVVVVGRG
jgi:hypothetical protein